MGFTSHHYGVCSLVSLSAPDSGLSGALGQGTTAVLHLAHVYQSPTTCQTLTIM